MTPEGELKRAAKRRLEQCGCFWTMIQEGAYAKPGDPDMVACISGRFVGLEFKTPDYRQSTIQQIRQREIEEAGGIYAIVHSLKELEEVINYARDYS